jgi:hypothetical protein
LDIAVIDGLSYDDAGGADDLRGGQPPVTFYRDAVNCGSSGLLGHQRRRQPPKEKSGGKKLKKTAHR